jgi:hypothetical protein
MLSIHDALHLLLVIAIRKSLQNVILLTHLREVVTPRLFSAVTVDDKTSQLVHSSWKVMD